MIFRTSCVVRVFNIFVLCSLVFLGEFEGSVQFSGHQVEKSDDEHPTSWAPPQDSNLRQRSRTDSLPLDLARELNEVTNLNQFMNQFVEDGAKILQDEFSSRSGSGAVLEGATCQPELKTIPLRDTNDGSIVYFPPCTRIERCGGCCAHELMTCEAIQKENINYTVTVTQYQGKPKLQYKPSKVISVEKHLKCKCGCRIKKENCTSLEEYEEKNCRCVCKNREEEASCLQQEKKVWNPSSCECQCVKAVPCSSGFRFDDKNCTCVKLPGKHQT